MRVRELSCSVIDIAQAVYIFSLLIVLLSFHSIYRRMDHSFFHLSKCYVHFTLFFPHIFELVWSFFGNNYSTIWDRNMCTSYSSQILLLIKVYLYPSVLLFHTFVVFLETTVLSYRIKANLCTSILSRSLLYGLFGNKLFYYLR